MKKPRAIALFSGGKDSMYSIQLGSKSYEIVCILSVFSTKGSAQLTDGLEIDNKIIRDIAENLPFHYEEIVIDDKNYLNNLILSIQNKIEQHKAEIVITGDLEHPEGIDKILNKELKIKTYSPAQEYVKKYGIKLYTEDVLNQKIKAVISAVRDQNLSNNFIGREFNEETITQIEKMGLDIVGEDGEFQTLVYESPFMKKKLVIKDFSLETDAGRDLKGYTYTRMSNVNYLLENKE